MKVELLESHAITSKLSGYWRVSIIDEVSSTQTQLKKQSLKNWDLLTTEFQSAGRGRLDRTFEAPKNSALLFSFYIEPKREKNYWGFIPLIAGAVVAKTINKITSSRIYSCKWPNDILCNGKKIAGLLAETTGNGVIVGIGINVSIDESQLPTPNASSILLESKLIVDRNILLADICNEFKMQFEKWDDGHDLESYYLEICSTICNEVKVIAPDGEKIGRAIGISNSGALLLESGEEVTVGDLIHLRD